MGRLLDRALRSVGLQRISASSNTGFQGGMSNRLNLDWAMGFMSANQKIRGNLKLMRERCRQLCTDNDYANRFLNKCKQNVIGSNGITLQIAFDEEMKGLLSEPDRLANKIESGWLRFVENATVDQRMSLVDAAQLHIGSMMQDGEVFRRSVKGYPHNRFRFALQFLDPDAIDVQFNRERQVGRDGRVVQNEICMGVEFDEWRRVVAVWAYDEHPAEKVGARRLRIPAEEIGHDFVFKLINQARGIPWMHSAMTRLFQVGKYEEAELLAARLGACKVAAIVDSKSPSEEEYQARQATKKNGKLEVNVEPASIWDLRGKGTLETLKWDHPNVNFGEFTGAMLRGAAVGMDVSYSGLTGDLRQVNFSSMRHGVLEEREGWRVLQTFAIQHFYKPVFADWLVMAVTTGQVELPSQLPLELVLESATWIPRGWDWVDPEKDVNADMKGCGAGFETLQRICAKRGLDWREVLKQRAEEERYARDLGLSLNFTVNGTPQSSDGSNSDAEDSTDGNQTNGKGALMNYVRMPE